MEDVGYYVTCILNCILSLQAWQHLTAGRISYTFCYYSIDLIRENAHHSSPILSANNYKALQACCKNSTHSKKDFLSWTEQSLDAHLQDLSSEKMWFDAAVSSDMICMKWCLRLIQRASITTTWYHAPQCSPTPDNAASTVQRQRPASSAGSTEVTT